MLVRRHRLRRELSADPARRLGQQHVAPGAVGRERRGDASEACSHDEDLGPHGRHAAH
jgi:hypothetical protein